MTETNVLRAIDKICKVMTFSAWDKWKNSFKRLEEWTVTNIVQDQPDSNANE